MITITTKSAKATQQTIAVIILSCLLEMQRSAGKLIKITIKA
jgi:hypothetical protein